MGHTLNALGMPQYNDDATNPGPQGDFQAAADWAAKVGGLLKISSADRGLLTPDQTQVGWLIAETDTGRLFLVTSTQPQGRMIYAPDTAWLDCPPLSAGWSPSFAGEKIQYRVQGGVLYYRGRVNGTATAPQQLFTAPLPVGARVDVDAPMTMSETNSAMNRVPVSVLANGHVLVYKGSGTPTELSLATIPPRPIA